MDSDLARFNMIEQQIRPWVVNDPHLLDLLLTVRREDFMPKAYRELAFADMEVPLGNDQVMLAPKVQARMVQDLALKPTDHVLEIGTGTGYTAALMAHLAARVTTLEIEKDLVDIARNNLANAAITTVDCFHVDASTEKPVDGSFDAIVLGGSVGKIPQNLLALLKVGGRLLCVLGQESPMRVISVTRVRDMDCTCETLWDTDIPALLNFPRVDTFVL